jgi:hypothetical protein
VRRPQVERRQRLGEQRGGPLPVPGEQEAGSAGEWLGWRIVETHDPELSFVAQTICDTKGFFR